MNPAEIKTISRQEAYHYDEALVYMPENERIRFGVLRVTRGWEDDYIRIEALQNEADCSPESETLYESEFQIAVLAK